MAFDKPVVVLDNGSHYMKAGFSCDNHPVSIFRTVVGRPKYLNNAYGHEMYDVKVGDEAIERVEDLELCSPMENGRIVHWDNMERIWHHCFYREFKMAPEDCTVMLGCSSTTPIDEKIKCCEVFFETLNSPGLCVQYQSVLSLYGSGYTTGISVDLGYDTTEINPVYEGGQLSYAHMQTNLSGKNITTYIQKSLEDKSHFNLSNNIIEGIKKVLYVTKHGTSSRNNYKKKFQLPSGEEIDVSDEVFLGAEMLFNPKMVALVTGSQNNYMPLQQAIVTSAMKCDAEIRDELLNGIIPWGGLATIPGLFERLEVEVGDIVDNSVNIFCSPEPYTVGWLGGAVFAGMSSSKKLWVSKKQFEEHGAKIIRNKFM